MKIRTILEIAKIDKEGAYKSIIDAIETDAQRKTEKYKTVLEANNKFYTVHTLEDFKIDLVANLLKAVYKYIDSNDIVKDIQVRNGGSYIDATIIRNGTEYDFSTSSVLSGGYNIQTLHSRYLVDTKLPKANQPTKIYERLTKEQKQLKIINGLLARIQLSEAREVELLSTTSLDFYNKQFNRAIPETKLDDFIAETKLSRIQWAEEDIRVTTDKLNKELKKLEKIRAS